MAFETIELARHDLERGERFGVPVALIVLLLLFGAVVATMLPLGLAVVSIVVALAAVAVIGQYNQLVFFVTMMVVMIGLAVGIDYSLLIVSRFKEEMGHGLDPKEAVAKTGNTAGRTVFFSGATVVLALIGLLIVPASFYQSLALGAILVVLASLAATLTLLPAVLSLLGHRVDLLTIPFMARFSLKSPEATEHGFWETITRVVTKLPVVSILVIAVPHGLRDPLLLQHRRTGHQWHQDRTQRRQHLPRRRQDEGGVHHPEGGVLRGGGQPRRSPEPGRDSRRRGYRRSQGAGGDSAARDAPSSSRATSTFRQYGG